MQKNEHSIKQQIWQCVASVPKGKVVSYGRVAKDCGYPSYARYVGTVLKQLPSDTTIPWHRVINGRGEISFPVGTDRYLEQRRRLENEGVVIDEFGKLKLAEYEP